MGEDTRLIERKQKDLNNFVELYQDRLEKMTSNYTKDLAPVWRRTIAQVTERIKELYEKAGATEDPKKLKAIINKANYLADLAKQLDNDLKTLDAKQQPYFTEALKHVYEDSYYFTAFGLEQAVKLAVAVPLLTPHQVLGVLANPWLPDGANYSTRLRANTAFLAKNMKELIQEGVAQGWGWNETARNISSKAGESYFNAVRLARTEFTRAAGQGANYCYMNNADILDGKRWNATKDSRTAAKDAANDGKLYDLDYDTELNPGVPGQRIPNHPNCRCLWSPVLSALGVQDKERIARQNPTNDGWGPNYYTEAKTYKEYAKEKGLPDLDERLKHDNPKQYLRPGESVADIEKKIVYWKHKGGAIAITKPDWENIKKTPKAKVSTTTTSNVEQLTVKLDKSDELAVANLEKELAGTERLITDRRAYSKKLLDNAGLDLKVGIRKLSGARGQCLGYFTPDEPIKYTDFQLLSTDKGAERYQLKTIYHELFHAKADGLLHDHDNRVTGIGVKAWGYVEESFTELAAHYMARKSGVKGTLVPSYEANLISILPKLKQLEEFKDCKTLEDFGAKVLKYRYGEEKTATWGTIHRRIKKVDVDTKAWTKKYEAAIREDIDSITEELYERATWENKLKDPRYYKDYIRKAIEKELEAGEGSWYNSALMAVVERKGL